jgi:hypothetical protein
MLQLGMSNEYISIEELTEKRTPSELLSWVKRKTEQIESTDEGVKALRLREGLAKQLMEEVYPLAMFGFRKFGNTDQILMQPIIGNQGYDAVVTDLRSKPASQSYVEITQSHEGESDYLRSLVLQRQGFVFMRSPVYKTGTKKTGIQVSIPAKAFSVGEIANKELEKIVDAAKRKVGKDYPINTSLVIVFDDDFSFRRAIDDSYLDTFVKRHILKLDLRFSKLYLLGWHNVFREFSLGKTT